jgi:protein-arginine kinase activator protein McsA
MEDETFSFERERSLKSLKDLLADVERSQPVTQLARLEQQLKKAIEKQEFEKAAQLRDRIRSLKDQPI